VSVGLVVKIIGDASDLKHELDSASASGKGFGAVIGGNVLQTAALAGAAGAAAGAIIEVTKAAAEDRDEQRKLEATIRTATGSTEDYTAATEAAIAAGQAKGFSDTDTRAALESLVTATHDVTQATELLGPAQDIARFAGVDLATAADAVAKAHAGNAKSLVALIPGLEKGATATETLANAQKAAAGQADTFAKSTAGQEAIVGDSFHELTETIGSVFLPVLDAVLPALIPIIQSLGTLVKAVLPILIPLLTVVAKVLGIVASALAIVVGWITQLINGLTNAIGKIGDFLSSINPLKNLKLPSIPFLNASAASAGGAPSALGISPYSSTVSGPTSVVVNVSGGDPDRVVATIARWAGHNGGSVAFARLLDRG
jgi:hypothetical protein